MDRSRSPNPNPNLNPNPNPNQIEEQAELRWRQSSPEGESLEQVADLPSPKPNPSFHPNPSPHPHPNPNQAELRWRQSSPEGGRLDPREADVILAAECAASSLHVLRLQTILHTVAGHVAYAAAGTITYGCRCVWLKELVEPFVDTVLTLLRGPRCALWYIRLQATLHTVAGHIAYG